MDELVVELFAGAGPGAAVWLWKDGCAVVIPARRGRSRPLRTLKAWLEAMVTD